MFYKIVTERTYIPLKNSITTFQRLLGTVLVNFSQSTNFLTLNTPGNCMLSTLNNLWLNLFEQTIASASVRLKLQIKKATHAQEHIRWRTMGWIIWSVACENTCMNNACLTFYVQYDFCKASVFWDQNAHVHTEDELTRCKLQIEWKFNSCYVSKRLPQKLRKILCKKNIATVSLARVQKLTFSYIHCSGEKSGEK